MKTFINTKQTFHYTFFLSLILFSSNLVFADKFANTKIVELREKIFDDNSKLSKVDLEIKNLDTKISDHAARINKFNATIQKIITTKVELQTKKTKQYETLAYQQQQLLKQLETTYILHRNNNFQKLASATNLQQLNRLLNYIDSFNKTSNTQITEIKQSLLQIEGLDKNLDSLGNEQKQLRQRVNIEFAELQVLKNDNLKVKQQLIASLSKSKSSLQFYESTQRKITNNNKLSRRDTDPPINPNTPFGRVKGKLPLPVDGQIDEEFKHSDNRQAVFIKAPEGQKVKSVFDGQVVFSNWMRGFGFLTIVNHGNGYMSLYGHNQSLLKKSGDKIKAGEVLALSGTSGNTLEPGVYFEIRHNGNTLNPLAWLQTDSNVA